jgi:cathepsin A (carboxypeptidase C)
MKRGISFLVTVGLIAIATSSKLNLRDDDVFLDEDYKAGLIPLTDGDDMFYWLFRSKGNPDTDPLVMWLTGGPGCASEVALFFENGPYTINDDLSLKKNDYSWNKISNLLYIDQPIGTGFSKAAKITHLDKTEEAIAAGVELFLRNFLE